MKRPSKKGDKFTCCGFEGVYTCKGFLREGSNVLLKDMPDIDHSGIKVQSEETELAYKLLHCALVEEQETDEHQYKVGDKVVPHSKSVGIPLDLCSMWINEGGKEQGYLYVVGEGSGISKEGVMVTTLMLSRQPDPAVGWNNYLPSDVTPYTEPKPVVEGVEPTDKPSFFCDSSRCWAESGTEKYCKFFQPCSENADRCILCVDSSSGKEKICVSTDAKDDYDKFKANYENISPMKNTEDTQAELQPHEEQTPTSESLNTPTKGKRNYYDPAHIDTCTCEYTKEANCRFFKGDKDDLTRCRFKKVGNCVSCEAIGEYVNGVEPSENINQDHNVTISALQFEIRTLTKQLQEKEAALERRAVAYNDELCRNQDEIEKLNETIGDLRKSCKDVGMKNYNLAEDNKMQKEEIEYYADKVKSLVSDSELKISKLESELAEYKATVNVFLRKLSEK